MTPFGQTGVNKAGRRPGEIFKEGNRYKQVTKTGAEQYIKKPGVAKRAFSATKVGAAKALSKTVKAVPYIGGALAVADEYGESGDFTKASLKGGFATAGAAIGGLSGLGVASIPLSIAGGIAGEYLGGKVDEYVPEQTRAAINTRFESIKDSIFKSNPNKGVLAPKGSADSAAKTQQIQQLSAENKMANINSGQTQAPVVINNQQAAAPAQPANIMLSRGDTRPTESALTRWNFQNYQA
jgi:uncharacterized protein YcfJ